MKDWNYENEQWNSLPAHLKHLPLFTRHFDLMSFFFRIAWGLFLKIFFNSYIRLSVQGDFHKLWKEQKRLILISNHASHLDAVSIAAGVPFKYWVHLYMSAAKDYWFKNTVFTFFSKHCLGAIPIDRKDKKGEAIKLCTTLLRTLPRIWLILFPEGTRSQDGYIKNFKRGVSLFAEKTDTPILFLYIDGNARLMPKGRIFPPPGNLTIHIGPIFQPAPVEELYAAYKSWVLSINPMAYGPEPDAPEEGLPENT